MTSTTTIRIDRATHEELKRLASQRRTTVAAAVARAVRVLRQDQMGHDLSAPLTGAETDWLDAELG